LIGRPIALGVAAYVDRVDHECVDETVDMSRIVPLLARVAPTMQRQDRWPCSTDGIGYVSAIGCGRWQRFLESAPVVLPELVTGARTPCWRHAASLRSGRSTPRRWIRAARSSGRSRPRRTGFRPRYRFTMRRARASTAIRWQSADAARGTGRLHRSQLIPLPSRRRSSALSLNRRPVGVVASCRRVFNGR
jgi:hypothetical protein